MTSSSSNKDTTEEDQTAPEISPAEGGGGASSGGVGKADPVSSGGEEESGGAVWKVDDPMEEDSVSPATVFCIRLKQPRSNLQHKMSVPELCRKFRSVLGSL